MSRMTLMSHVLQCNLSCTSVGTKIEIKSFFLTIHECCACSSMGALRCQPPAPVENHLLLVFWPVAGMLPACVCLYTGVNVCRSYWQCQEISSSSLPSDRNSTHIDLGPKLNGYHMKTCRTTQITHLLMGSIKSNCTQCSFLTTVQFSVTNTKADTENSEKVASICLLTD